MDGGGWGGVYVPVCCDCASVTLNLSLDKRFQCRAGRWLLAEHCCTVRVGRYYYYYWLTLCSCSLPANTLLHGHCHTKNDDGSTSTWWVRNICIVFCQWRSVIIYYLIVLFLYNIFSSAGDAYQPMKYHKLPTSRDNPRLNVLHSSVNGRIGPDNCYQTRRCQDFRPQSCSSKLPDPVSIFDLSSASSKDNRIGQENLTLIFSFNYV